MRFLLLLPLSQRYRITTRGDFLLNVNTVHTLFFFQGMWTHADSWPGKIPVLLLFNRFQISKWTRIKIKNGREMVFLSLFFKRRAALDIIRRNWNRTRSSIRSFLKFHKKRIIPISAHPLFEKETDRYRTFAEANGAQTTTPPSSMDRFTPSPSDPNPPLLPHAARDRDLRRIIIRVSAVLSR